MTLKVILLVSALVLAVSALEENNQREARVYPYPSGGYRPGPFLPSVPAPGGYRPGPFLPGVPTPGFIPGVPAPGGYRPGGYNPGYRPGGYPSYPGSGYPGYRPSGGASGWSGNPYAYGRTG